MDDAQQPWDIPGKEAHPVVNVSWYQSRNYARWAAMRLLTEAEWEKAASWESVNSDQSSGNSGQLSVLRKLASMVSEQAAGGKKRVYPWGDEFDKNRCNTNESGIGTTTPVGQYSPQGDSPYGCADMAGNVWEWTSSLLASYPYRADDGREDQSSSDPRMQRGGAFGYEASNARCADRFDSSPDGWSNSGFRCGVGAAEE